MAEILALVASFTALLQLASYARKFARALHGVSRGAGSAMEEIESFANQARNFSVTIGLAQVSLSDHCRKYKDSRLLAYISSNELLENIAFGSTRRRLYDATRRVKKRMRSKFTLVTVLGWMYQKSSVRELFPEMNHITVSLTLLMSTATFEAVNLQLENLHSSSYAESKQLKEEIKYLKGVIKCQLRTIDRLEEQIERVHGPSFKSLDSTEFVHSDERSRHALFDLGMSIIERGKVPRSPKRSNHSSGYSSERERSPSVHAPSSGNGNTYRSDRTLDLPCRTVLCANEDSWNESTTGYVQAMDGQIKNVTAVVGSALDGNIISIAQMLDLGLVIEERTGGGVDWLDFGNGSPEMSMGSVTITWMHRDHEASPQPPITLQCEVTARCQRGLMLGKSFLDKVRQDWSSQENRGRTDLMSNEESS